MKESFRMIAVLTLVAVVSGGVLAWFNKFTEKKVEFNKLMELKKALSEVVPGMERYEEIIKERDFEVYKIFKGEKLAGYAIVAEGNGYQDKIRLIFGISEDLTKIYALRVLEQKETPGLGARITEADYLKQWENRDASHGIKLVKGKTPEKEDGVGAISGATISSNAVVNIVNKGIERFKKTLKEMNK